MNVSYVKNLYIKKHILIYLEIIINKNILNVNIFHMCPSINSLFIIESIDFFLFIQMEIRVYKYLFIYRYLRFQENT